MKYTFGAFSLIGLVVAARLCSNTAAGQTLQALDVKTGEWETTTVSQNSGMPPIPPGVLDKMPPDQRAKMEAMMKARMGGSSTVTKRCVTGETLAKAFQPNNVPSQCRSSVTASSGSKQEMALSCENGKTTTQGTFQIVAVDSTTIQGALRLTAASSGSSGNPSSGQGMNINVDFTSKWVGPVCSEVSKSPASGK